MFVFLNLYLLLQVVHPETGVQPRLNLEKHLKKKRKKNQNEIAMWNSIDDSFGIHT